MRLAFIRRRYDFAGGAERFLEGFLSHLAQGRELRISLLSERWSGAALPDGLHWQRIPALALGSWLGARSFERRVCAAVARGNFDLVQSHERVPCADLYRAGDGLHREWLGQRARVLGPARRLSLRLNPLHRYLLDAERRLFTSPRLRAVITNSEMVRQELLAAFPFPAERVHTIYSGVDLERFHPCLRGERAAVRATLGVPQEVPLFLFVGSGFERKGLAASLKALPEGAWLLVAGRDRRQTRYQALADRLGKADRVRFLGPQRDVAPLYGAADALVLPTLYDPFPNVCFEAMAAGLPVVTSWKSGAAELVREGESGFLGDALDLTGLSAALEALCDPTRARPMGEAARATAEGYPMGQGASATLALYETLLAGRSS